MEDITLARKNGIAPAAFLEKLYDIMENASLVPYISWQPDGLSFLIKDVQAVSEFVLPYYFKHNNIQSFVRQLNMYNFTKTRHDSNYREFRQPWFQRGRRHLLSMIKRKSQISADKNAALKRKYNAHETDNDTSYSVTLIDEVSAETGKDWDGDDEGVGEEVSTSSTCSSDNDIIDVPVGRSKEIEELKLCMDNIQSQMKSLHERYNLLSVSYTYLHDKFDTFQNLHSCKQSSKYIAEKKKCVSLSHSSNHTPRVSNDDNYHLSRIVSVDQSYRGPLEADLALRSCSHLSDAYLTLPPSITTTVKSDKPFAQNNYLCKLLGRVDNENSQSSFRTRYDTMEMVSGLGLDAMAAAVSLRCVHSPPLLNATTEPNLRSSLADLLDAACRFVM